MKGRIYLKIFLTDLDGTCIYSNRQLQSTDGFIEVDARGSYHGYMNSMLYRRLENDNNHVLFVPLTTRSQSQYERIRFPFTPTIALAANGAILYENGKKDYSWEEESNRLIQCALPELKKALTYPNVQLVDGYFATIHCSDEDMAKDMYCLWQDQMNHALVNIYRIRKKVFVLPKVLEKGEALVRLKKRYPITYCFGAGDSAMDDSLLDMVNMIVDIDTLKYKGGYLNYE